MFLLALFLFVGVVPGPLNSEAIRVLILASYNENDPCGSEQIKGIKEKFYEIYGTDAVEIRTLYMRGRKVNVTDSTRKVVAEQFYQAFKEFKPKVVFLVDDLAIDYMIPYLQSDSADYIVVFTGMNKKLLDYQRKYGFMERIEGHTAIPKKNITGIIEKIYAKLSIKYALKLFPASPMDTVVFVFGPDVISQIVKEQIFHELIGFNEIQVKAITVKTFEDLIDTLNYINSNPHIPFYYPLTLTIDSAGKLMDMNDLAPYYKKFVKKPDITLNKFYCYMGFFGGVSLDFKAMGEAAALKAIDYLRGEKDMRKLRVEEANVVEIVFNISRIKELSLKIPFWFFVNSNIVSK